MSTKLYDQVAYENSKHLTLRYSTSFGISSRLLGKKIRPHIYAVYGLVRIADEIVDVYQGPDAAKMLDDLERATYAAIQSGYGANPIVHAYALTARRYGIGRELIAPFFSSMRMDVSPRSYSPEDYRAYIHGSAEVVGLMCLRVFCAGDSKQYDKLAEGAAALGAAYQKVNFLRDLAADYKELGRVYFPGITFDSFDDSVKQDIITDIKKDFALARQSLRQLPASSRLATTLSYVYYRELLKRLEATPAAVIKTTRVRVPPRRKISLMIWVLLGRGAA